MLFAETHLGSDLVRGGGGEDVMIAAAAVGLAAATLRLVQLHEGLLDARQHRPSATASAHDDCDSLFASEKGGIGPSWGGCLQQRSDASFAPLGLEERFPPSNGILRREANIFAAERAIGLSLG